MISWLETKISSQENQARAGAENRVWFPAPKDAGNQTTMAATKFA
jgi:hypothetical protein